MISLNTRYGVFCIAELATKIITDHYQSASTKVIILDFMPGLTELIKITGIEFQILLAISLIKRRRGEFAHNNKRML